MPIFCRKNVHSFRNAVLLCQFFQNFHQKPLAVMPIFDQKHQFYQNYTIIWAKKVNVMPFFSDFSRKNHRSHAHILSEKCPFFQKHCALMWILSKFSSKTPCCHAHIWSKTSILSNLHYIMSQKSQYDAPFFRFLIEKSSLSCPYFIKNVHSPKSTLLSSLDFVKKNGHSLKNTVLLSHFFKFFMTNPLLSRPYLVKKKR